MLRKSGRKEAAETLPPFYCLEFDSNTNTHKDCWYVN